MGRTKQINIIQLTNRTYYFHNDQINLKDFDVSLLKVDKKKLQRDWHLLHRLCDCLKIANCNKINIVNPLCLMIDKIIGHFEKKSGNKY